MAVLKDGVRMTARKYIVKVILHHLFDEEGRLALLIQWKGYAGKWNEFTWEPKACIGEKMLREYYDFWVLKHDTALATLRVEWTAHRAANIFTIQDYKQYALTLAFANKTLQLKTGLLVPPPSPTLIARSSSIRATSPASEETIQVPVKKSSRVKATVQSQPKAIAKGDKAKPNPLPRRKSTRLLRKQHETSNEVDSLGTPIKKMVSGLKGILKHPKAGSGAMSENAYNASNDNERIPNNTSSTVSGFNKLRPRKSVGFKVDESGSPLPDTPRSSAAVSAVTASAENDDLGMEADIALADKENMAPLVTEVKPLSKQRKSLLAGWVPGLG